MHRRLFLLIYVLSGAAALVYEVLWLRLLTLSMGHTAAAVGILLAAFMGGLAIGAWHAGRIAASMTPARALRTYASLEMAIAVCALLLPLALYAARPVLSWAYANGEAGRLFDVTLGLLSLLLLSVPAAAMGATYPIAVRWYAGSAARAGGLYAANTAGAAAGAALTGFVLLPMLGAQATTLVGVALNTICALGALALANYANSQLPNPNFQHPNFQHPWELGAWELGVHRAFRPASDCVWPPWRWESPDSSRSSIRWPGRACWRWCSGRPPTHSAPCWSRSSPGWRSGLCLPPPWFHAFAARRRGLEAR